MLGTQIAGKESMLSVSAGSRLHAAHSCLYRQAVDYMLHAPVCIGRQ